MQRKELIPFTGAALTLASIVALILTNHPVPTTLWATLSGLVAGGLGITIPSGTLQTDVTTALSRIENVLRGTAPVAAAPVAAPAPVAPVAAPAPAVAAGAPVPDHVHVVQP
jgi:hypothetical protein